MEDKIDFLEVFPADFSGSPNQTLVGDGQPEQYQAQKVNGNILHKMGGGAGLR